MSRIVAMLERRGTMIARLAASNPIAVCNLIALRNLHRRLRPKLISTCDGRGNARPEFPMREDYDSQRSRRVN
ncbi:hypothetical protein, partial [Bradyrhizobium elkanii]|uniref:hypothetical protein n=1 Tax=Bradyrhizobium elkanii TaxID=29448 RepID=UPI001AEBE56B